MNRATAYFVSGCTVIYGAYEAYSNFQEGLEVMQNTVEFSCDKLKVGGLVSSETECSTIATEKYAKELTAIAFAGSLFAYLIYEKVIKKEGNHEPQKEQKARLKRVLSELPLVHRKRMLNSRKPLDTTSMRLPSPGDRLVFLNQIIQEALLRQGNQGAFEAKKASQPLSKKNSQISKARLAFLDQFIQKTLVKRIPPPISHLRIRTFFLGGNIKRKGSIGGVKKITELSEPQTLGNSRLDNSSSLNLLEGNEDAELMKAFHPTPTLEDLNSETKTLQEVPVDTLETSSKEFFLEDLDFPAKVSPSRMNRITGEPSVL